MGLESGVRTEEPGLRHLELMEVLKRDNYVSFDAEITPEERRSIADVRIEKALPQFDYFGPINDELVQQLKTHLRDLGDNSEEILSSLSLFVARISEKTTSDFKQEAAWVMLRSSLADEMFDMPRWHQDGHYFAPSEINQKSYKCVMTIKGAITRFAVANDPALFEQLSMESILNENENQQKIDILESEETRIRKEIDAVIREIYPAKDGEGVYFLVGQENAVIHSEPKIDSPRMFMAVVPGSSEQIRMLKERWYGK